MNRFFLALLLVVVLLPGVALAADTELISIDTDEPAEYLAGQMSIINLTITNSDLDAWFSISILGVPSGWMSPETSLIKVARGQSAVVKVYVNIPKDSTPASYGYDLTVTRTADGERIQQKIYVTVVQRIDALISDLSLSCFQCDKDVSVTGSVKNIGTEAVPLALNIAFNSEFKLVDMGTIDVNDEKDFFETFNLESFEPGQYDVSVDLMAGERRVYSDKRTFNILSHKDISYKERVMTTPLGKSISLEAVNGGNVEDTADLTYARNSEWWVVYFGQPTTSMTDTDYTWKMTMQPGENVVVSFYEIYWPVALIVIIMIIGGIFLYLQMTSIDLRKSVRGHHELKKDHEISVALILRNYKIAMDSIIAKDIVPHGFTVVGTFETLKPLVRKVSEGTELIWRVGSMKANEERVLHYRIKPVRDMYGDVDLPLAAMRAKHGEKSIIKHSNIVELHGIPKEQETRVRVMPAK